MKDWQVYLLKCSDNSLYCGVTNNLDARIKKHKDGKASKYTRSRLPVELVTFRDNLTKSDAFRLEYQIKKLNAEKKVKALETRDYL